MKQPAVYILASRRNGTLYVGVTSNLPKRVWEHKQDLIEGFTKAYRVHQLVYYEVHETMEAAIMREKRIKKWNRSWKLRLIEQNNPRWNDLFDSNPVVCHPRAPSVIPAQAGMTEGARRRSRRRR